MVREERCEREPGELTTHRVRNSTRLIFQHHTFEPGYHGRNSLRELWAKSLAVTTRVNVIDDQTDMVLELSTT